MLKTQQGTYVDYQKIPMLQGNQLQWDSSLGHLATHILFEYHHLAPLYPMILEMLDVRLIRQVVVLVVNPKAIFWISPVWWDHWRLAQVFITLCYTFFHHSPIFEPVDDIILKGAEFKHIISFFCPLTWMAWFYWYFCSIVVGMQLWLC